MNQPSVIQPDDTLQGQYAGFASRLIAFVLDRVIIITIILITNTVVIVVLSFFNLSLEQILDFQADQSTFQKLLSILFLLISAIINFGFYYGYFIFFWMMVGQTPGKMMMGVRIVSTNGRPITFFKSVRRLIGYWISMIFLFMGFLWVLVSDTRQGWHDKIAGTYVIYSWEARSGFKFFNRLSRYADKRAQAYERKHPSLPAETSTDQPQETNQID